MRQGLLCLLQLVANLAANPIANNRSTLGTALRLTVLDQLRTRAIHHDSFPSQQSLTNFFAKECFYRLGRGDAREVAKNRLNRNETACVPSLASNR